MSVKKITSAYTPVVCKPGCALALPEELLKTPRPGAPGWLSH